MKNEKKIIIKNGKKNEKMEKNDEKIKKNETWIQTQNPPRFPRFTVVVVTFFVKILDDFHYFFRDVSLSLKENQQPVLWGQRFPEEKCQFSLELKQQYTFFRRNSTKKTLKSAPLAVVIF